MGDDLAARWALVLEEQKRRAEYEAEYREALRRFNQGIGFKDGRMYRLEPDLATQH